MIETKEFAISYEQFSEITINEYKKAFKATDKKNLYIPAIIYLVVIVVIFCLSISCGLLILLLSICGAAFLYRWKFHIEPKKLYDNPINATNFQLSRYIFNKSEFFVEMHNGIEAKYLFSSLGKVTIEEQYIILWITSGFKLYLPSDAFEKSGDFEKISDLLQ